MLNIIVDSTNTINIDSLYDILAQIIIQNEETAVETFTIRQENEGEDNECSIFEM